MWLLSKERRLRRETLVSLCTCTCAGPRIAGRLPSEARSAARLRRETMGFQRPRAAMLLGEKRLRRETVEGFPLFVGGEARAAGERRLLDPRQGPNALTQL